MPAQRSPALQTEPPARELLVEAILDLEEGRNPQLLDLDLACQLAHHLKPHIDRLVALRQEPPATAEAEEDLFELLLPEDATSTLRLQTEDKESRGMRPVPARSALHGVLPEIASLSGPEKARWIFMERFITLEQHQKVLGCELTPADLDRCRQELDRLLLILTELPEIAPLVDRNDLPALQKNFATILLLFRSPHIGDLDGHPIPCTIENLRHRYPDYFYKRHKTPNWYQEYEFYTAPVAQSGWVLCETEYLNCTLQAPSGKLNAYAKRRQLPREKVRQKTVLEDLYDRILAAEVLGEHLFQQSCYSCTSTSYNVKEKGPLRLVYMVQRHQKIAIHGRSGLPRWRITRRLWPGVFPAIAFSSTSQVTTNE